MRWRPWEIARLTIVQALMVTGLTVPVEAEAVAGVDRDAAPAPAAVEQPISRQEAETFIAARRDQVFRRAAELAGMSPRDFAATTVADPAWAVPHLTRATGLPPERFPADKVRARLSEWARTLATTTATIIDQE